MATQVQNRRGSTAEHSTFTGAVAELTVDTTKDVVVVHDGSTAGGFPMLRQDQANLPTSAPSNGVYLPSSNNVSISTNGTQRLLIDSNGKISSKRNRSNTSGQVGLEIAPGDTTVAYGFRVDSANNSLFLDRVDNASTFLAVTATGQLGLGTSAPGSLNSNANQLVVGSGTGSQGLTVFAGSSSDANIYFADGTTGSQQTIGYIQYRHASDRFDFGTNDTTRMSIDSSGRVGIGTTSPDSLLHLRNTGGDVRHTLESADGSQAYTNYSAQSSEFAIGYVRASGSDTSFRFCAAGDLTSNERMRIDGSGRLLVGTSSTSSVLTNLLQGNSSSSTGDAILKLAIGTATPANGDTLGRIAFTDSGHSDSAQIIAFRDGGTWSGSSKPSRLTFSTTADGASSPTERMRITNSGYSKHKGGGANYYSDTASYHEFTSNQTGSVVLEVVARTSSFTSNVIDTVVETTTNNTSYSFFSGSNFNGQRAAIYGNGAYGSSPNTYGGLSDIKLKENIAPASSQWDDVKSIEVVNYNLIGEGGKHLGVIAQQAEQVSPGLIDEIPDKDGDGNLTGETTKFVKYSILYMKAVKALQEAMERIETLEAKVAALEGV